MRIKPIIIALVGESGSGKTTLGKFLEHRFKIPQIVSYTTRPMRLGEHDGLDHYFVDEAPSKEEMFAYTQYGGYEYWTLNSQFCKHPIVTYIVDEKGLNELQAKTNEGIIVCAINIKRPYNPTSVERKERDKTRIAVSDVWYDGTIVNKGSLRDFYKEAIFVVAEQVARNYHEV